MNLLAIDPGAKAGYAWVAEGAYFSGVWDNKASKPRNADNRVRWNGLRFLTFMQRVRRVIRDNAIEAVCIEHNVMPDRSDENSMLAGGFMCCIEMAIELERKDREIVGPMMFTTAEWRSAYWGKYPQLPKEWEPERKRAAHKQRALQACADEGWSVKDDNEAEALLMLVAFQKKMDPQFAFSRGGDAKAHQLDMVI